MATIDLLPDVVNLKGYAGDTLFFYIWTKTEPDFVWTGLVRETHAGPPVATFDIAAPEYVPEGAVNSPEHVWRVAVSLPATKTADLATPDKFKGVHDIQIQDGTLVKTLIRGAVNIEVDVTRDGLAA